MLPLLSALLLLQATGGMVIIAFKQSDLLYPILLGCAAIMIMARGKLHGDWERLLPCLLLLGGLVLVAVLRGQGLEAAEFKVLVKVMVAGVLVQAFALWHPVLLARSLVRVHETLMGLSLLTFLVLNLVPRDWWDPFVLNYGSVYRGNDLYSLLGLANFRELDFAKYGLFRNQGVYWEPGVFAVLTLLSACLRHFVLCWRWRPWLYALALLSSLSMGGLLIGLFLLATFAVQSGIDRSRWRKALQMGLLAVLVLVVAMPETLMQVPGKVFHRDVTHDMSTQTRVMDLQLGVQASMQKPLWGHGAELSDFFAVMEDVLGYSKESRGGGISNALVQMLYQYGIPLTGLYLWLLWRWAAWVAASYRWWLWLGLCFMLMLEPLHMSLMFLVLLFMAPMQAGHGCVGKAPGSRCLHS